MVRKYMYHTCHQVKAGKIRYGPMGRPTNHWWEGFHFPSRPTSYRTLGTIREHQMILKKAKTRRVICAHLQSVSDRHEPKQIVFCR